MTESFNNPEEPFEKLILIVKCFGNLAKHSNDHCKIVQENYILQKIIGLYSHLNKIYNQNELTCSQENIHSIQDKHLLTLIDQCKISMEAIIKNSYCIDSLLDFLYQFADEISSLLFCLKQINKCVGLDSNKKKLFAKKEGLKIIMQIKHDDQNHDSNLRKSIEDILQHYPEELVRLYTPNYSKLLLKKLHNESNS